MDQNPKPRKYRISGYTAKPHGYTTEIVDAAEWSRYRAGDGQSPLKQIVDWVLVENEGDPDPADIPRSMEGEGLSIASFYTEAGYFREANVIKVTDGERTALYAPFKTLPKD